MIQKSCLYIVATPIGNPKDITLRALEVLKESDAVICEEYRMGSKLLKRLDIPSKDLITLNEHNEKDQVGEIFIRLAQKQSLALISDCGTPVFADPGHFLIKEVTQAGFRVIPIPGPSSLLSTLSILDFKLERFVFAGFLSRVPAQREKELRQFQTMRMPVVVMDTPYRMTALLEDISRVFGKNQIITLACDLTLHNEKIYRGSVANIIKETTDKKAEFVLVIHASAGYH